MATRYTEISFQEFAGYLEQIKPGGFQEATQGKFSQAGEVVMICPSQRHQNTSIVIFTSIDKFGGVSRESGTDAIRVCITKAGRIVWKSKKVLRTKNWRDNLKDRLVECSKIMTSKECDKCGSVMVPRKGGNRLFWGCSSYPSCRHTRQYN